MAFIETKYRSLNNATRYSNRLGLGWQINSSFRLGRVGVMRCCLRRPLFKTSNGVDISWYYNLRNEWALDILLPTDTQGCAALDQLMHRFAFRETYLVRPAGGRAEHQMGSGE